MRTTGMNTRALIAAATISLVLAASALASNEPVMEFPERSELGAMSPSGLDSNGLYFQRWEDGKDGVYRLNPITQSLTKLVGYGSDRNSIEQVAVRDGVVAYTLLSNVRAPRGVAREVRRLFVMNSYGRNRREIHREYTLISDRDDGRNCGREILDLQLLPRRQIQVIVNAYGRMAKEGRCTRASDSELTKRQRQHAIRFSMSGKRIFSTSFKIKGSLTARIYFTVSGNGRYVLNRERSRVRVVDLLTGRTNFLPQRRNSAYVFAYPGPGQSSVVVARNPVAGGGFTYEFRLYRDVRKPSKYKRIGSAPDGTYLPPTWCGNRLFIEGQEVPESLLRVDSNGRSHSFLNLPAPETLDAVVCDQSRAGIFSSTWARGLSFLRVNAFRSAATP